MLWSHLMSAQPRSDRCVDQGEDLKKGNTHKNPRSTSIVVVAWSVGSRGSIATRRRSPHLSLFSLLPSPASPAPARPRFPWRSRAFGGGVTAADRENLAKKEVSPDGRKEEGRRKEESR
jgi:hypothetical protein